MSFASLYLGCLHLAPSNVLAIEAHSEQATIEGDPSLVACERLLFLFSSDLGGQYEFRHQIQRSSVSVRNLRACLGGSPSIRCISPSNIWKAWQQPCAVTTIVNRARPEPISGLGLAYFLSFLIHTHMQYGGTTFGVLLYLRVPRPTPHTPHSFDGLHQGSLALALYLLLAL